MDMLAVRIKSITNLNSQARHSSMGIIQDSIIVLGVGCVDTIDCKPQQSCRQGIVLLQCGYNTRPHYPVSLLAVGTNQSQTLSQT